MTVNVPTELKRENILESRKTAGFVIMVLSILATVALATYMKTPPEIAIAALYVNAAGGLFTIGGQSLVDSVAKWRGPASVSTSETIRTTETVK